MGLQSAKRFGLETEGNLELELRLRRMEIAIGQRALGNEDAITLSRGNSSTVPQVTGLSLGGAIPGGFTVNWSAVTISDLRRYEVQFATDLGFTTGLQKFTAATTTLAFTTADTSAATVYFTRVRAVNSAGTPGTFSITLNTTTGQAESQDIADEAITAEKIDTSSPILYSGLDDEDVGSKLALRGYIDGLILSNNTLDAAHLDIAVGMGRDSTNIASLFLPAAFTKKIDTDWAEGSDAGGFPSALTLAVNTWYDVFLLKKDVDDTVDIGFDTSATAANLLADATAYSKFRLIGSVLTNTGDTDILAFFQRGNKVFWQVPTLDQDTNLSTSDADYSVKTPLGRITEAILNVHIQGGSNEEHWLYDPATTSAAPSTTAAPLGNIRTPSGGAGHQAQFSIGTDTLSQISARSSGTPNFRVVTIGYIDPRGQNL